MSQNCIVVFYSHRFLRRWAFCTRNLIFPPCCVGESILGPKVNKCHVFLSCSFHVAFMFLSCVFHFASSAFDVPFMFLSCSCRVPLMFLSCSFHVPFMFLWCSFRLAFRSFHFQLLCIKHTGLRKVPCSNRSSGHPPKGSRLHHILLSSLVSCYYRFGSLSRLPSLGFMNMSMYKFVVVLFYSYRFLGR